mmetsp:Transcript_2129/g.4812  ORF Transcript_2129/g.4812 Transcript_2129/m.4812 type:complete len:157 (+) Transcript_2129:229-699(+)
MAVGFSILLFLVEVCFWTWWGSTWHSLQAQKRMHVALVCVHLAVEDSFQAVLYAFVAASQARVGLGLTASMLVAVLQAAAFTVAKIAEAVGALDFRRFHGEGAERPERAPELGPTGAAAAPHTGPGPRRAALTVAPTPAPTRMGPAVAPAAGAAAH